jgi:small-conductance mechanosensitive channel
MRCSILSSAVLLLFSAMLLGQDFPEDSNGGASLDPTQTASRLANARQKLESLPQGAAADSDDAFLRQAWERRIELLEEAIQLLTRSEAQEAIPAQMEERRRLLTERRAEYEKLPAPEAAASPTEEALVELEARASAQRERVKALRDIEAEKTQHAEGIITLLAEARKRLQTALERESRLTEERGATTEPAKREILDLRAENASLDAGVARLQTRVLDRTREQERSLAPLRLAEREFAELLLQRIDQEYVLSSAVLDAAIDREMLGLEAEITRLEAAIASAKEPSERFLATKQLEITRVRKNERDHTRVLRALKSDLEEQRRRWAAEVSERESLRDYLSKAGTGEQAADRIKFTLQRVKIRRQALARTLRRDISDELVVYRSTRLELENKLFFLKEAWERDVEATVLGLSDPEVASFRAAAGSLVEPYRTALLEDRDLVADIIGAGDELQMALIERRETLENLEGFIRSRVFWIRDAKPLGPAIWPRVEAEAAVVAKWARDLDSPTTLDRLSASVLRPGALPAALLLLLALPIGLFWARQRLRRIVTRMNDRTVRNDAKFTDRILAVATGVVSVTLLPAYLFIASRITAGADLPEALAPVLTTLLRHLAIFLFFLFLSRSFFSGRGTAQVQFGMDRDAAHTLHGSLRLGLLAYLVFFCLRSILSGPPFLLEDTVPLEVLPRIAYTLFLIFAVTAGILLLQPRSGFSTYFAATLGGGFFGRRWRLFSIIICLLGVGLVALEIAGYRYSAGVFALSLLQSLVVILLLVPLYKGLVFAIEAVARRPRASGAFGGEEESPPTGPDGATPEEIAPADGGKPAGPATEPVPAPDSGGGQLPQVRKVLRALFILGGIVLIASLWGIGVRTFGMLADMKAYDLRGTEEFVSVADLLKTVLYLLGTYFLLKYLPGIYEYTIFPRLGFDSGLKYAILTMSRYGLFVLGVIMALSQIHLDLGRLQWLMAAMGVGLGFGLQEIVSNFVSGIILLVERPVRVGDVVTVGTTAGRVQRINIRATTVVNFDRQEIIVPNRSLITKEVTNWTRGDTIIRLVVPIGVAYGNDIDEVTELLLQIALAQPDVLREPAPQAYFVCHGESSLDFELRVFIPNPSVKMSLLHNLNRTINRELKDRDIEIPFPQRDLHIRSREDLWPMGKEPEA